MSFSLWPHRVDVVESFPGRNSPEWEVLGQCRSWGWGREGSAVVVMFWGLTQHTAPPPNPDQAGKGEAGLRRP